MVRVDAVGVVRRDKEALRKHAQIPFLIQSQRKRDAPERIGKQARRRALLRLAADLLIVERAEDRHAAGGLRGQKALEQTEHAAEVVQPRGENKLVFRAEASAACAHIQTQVFSEHLVLLHACSLGHDAAEAAGGLLHPVERERVDICHELKAVVCGAVHVDGDGGDHGQIAVHIDQLRFQLPVLRRHDAACDGKRPVEPCAHEHTAVFLRRQLHIRAGLFLRVVLDLERGGVGMRGGHQEACGRTLRDAEGQERRAIARDEVFPARRQRPCVLLPQLRIAVSFQPLRERLHGVVAAGAGGKKVEKLFGKHERTLHVSFSFSIPRPAQARKGEFSRGSFQCGKNVLNYRKIKAMEAFL